MEILYHTKVLLLTKAITDHWTLCIAYFFIPLSLIISFPFLFYLGALLQRLPMSSAVSHNRYKR